MPKLEKGSELAKEHMAKIRAMRKGKQSTQNETASMINNVEPIQEEVVTGRRGRLVKGSAEAKAYMVSIRTKNK
jgi:hypothetical protein